MADFTHHDYTDGGHGLPQRLEQFDSHYAPRGVVGGRMVAAVPDSLPATSTSAYASGDVLGGKMKLTDALRFSAGSGYLQDLTVALKSVQTAALDAVLFRADPSSSTFTDNAAASIAAADLGKWICTVPFEVANSVGTNTLYEANKLARSLKLDAGRDLWLVLVWRGAPTLATTADLASVRANIAVD